MIRKADLMSVFEKKEQPLPNNLTRRLPSSMVAYGTVASPLGIPSSTDEPAG